MKEDRSGTGWKKIVDLLHTNSVRHKRKRDEEERWLNMVHCWISYRNFFDLIRNVNICNIEELKFYVNTIKNSIIRLKWKFTPWMHILCYHFIYFESQNVRPILLSCFAPEGHHRQLKRDFHHSLHSTRRRNTHSGLTDVLCHDNILISLISKRIYPWENLKLKFGNKINERKKGHFINYMKNKYPILYEFKDIEEEEEVGENNKEEDVEIVDKSDYDPDDTSETED